MSSLTLYSLSETLVALLDTLDLCDTPEKRAECEADIERTVRAQIQKTDDFCRFLAHLESQTALATAEIDRLQARRRALNHALERLEHYAVRVMQQLNLRKLDGATSRLSLRQNPPAVEITGEALIPGEYKVVIQEVRIDKRAIKEAIQSGSDVPGANLRTGTSLVRR